MADWIGKKSENSMRQIKVGLGRNLKVTPVFDTYWKFATERQNVFFNRVNQRQPPWTKDPVIAEHRFTNVYRASDRVSQYLIKQVIYGGPQTSKDIFFRTLLFKIFNKIETWERLQGAFGEISWSSFNYSQYSKVLDQMKTKSPIYSAAYIMPQPSFGMPSKHRNHLRLIEYMMKDSAYKKIENSGSLLEVYQIMRSYPSLGSFLAFQFAIDLNYSEMIHFSEMDFVVAGPGARNGIRKCFADIGGLAFEDVIREMAQRADHEFARLGLKFTNLWGRPLQLIDCQNLFCEVDKYARVVHPQFSGETKRSKIKQKYSRCLGDIPQWYPPKWKLEATV